MMATVEYVLWARRADAEEWQRDIIAVRPDREALAPARHWAEANGFVDFTVQTLDGSAPDFAAAVRR